jgi:hypothetical protein
VEEFLREESLARGKKAGANDVAARKARRRASSTVVKRHSSASRNHGRATSSGGGSGGGGRPATAPTSVQVRCCVAVAVSGLFISFRL